MIRPARLAVLCVLAASACVTGNPEPSASALSPTTSQVEEANTAARDPATIELSFRRLASGLDQPVAIASAYDGSGRLFIVEQPGRIRIWTPGGGLRAQPYLAIPGRVQSGGEQGMLGLAFHPNFTRNRFFFVSYTDSQGDLRVVRFRGGSTSASNDALESTHTTVIEIAHRLAGNHNGGQLNFGTRFLYVSTGDGGSGGDPQGNAQNKNSLLGKILRIDVDRRCGERNYCNPSTNPFFGASRPGNGSVFHYGLRNAWRWTFNRGNGSMWIADVGQSAWEEISVAPAGEKGLNFGWDCREGAHQFEINTYCSGQTFKEPRHEYANTGGRCAIIGGYVYHGSDDPELEGIYPYSDHCSQEVWALGRHDGRWKNARVATAPGNISAFGERPDGELFAVTLNGSLYRVRARVV